MRQVKQKKKKTSLKFKVWLIILLGIGCGIGWLYQAGMYDRLLQWGRESYTTIMKRMGLVLNQVNVEGHVRTNLRDIHQVTNLSQGMPILDVDLDDIYTKIAALPWVKSVRIKRQLPSTLSIHIWERMPVAVWQNNKKYMPLDSDGHPIQDDKANLSGLILVVGKDAPNHTIELLQILKKYPVIEQRVKSAVRVGNRRWDLNLDQVDGLVVELPEKNMEQALKRLQNSIQNDKILSKNLERINLREPDRMIVQVGGKK
ncbi:MAG: cell division protein FtsQ/DivIB [Pseudomonadota bacterium]|nr:cell division protein FtsQ/DivIB [Pseudomonadota bacterium]